MEHVFDSEVEPPAPESQLLNFRSSRDPGAIPSLAALIVTCAALDAEAWMITR